MNTMRKKPDLNAFLSGGAAAAAETPSVASEPIQTAADSSRITKTIRMTRALEMRLKEEAFRRSMAEGKRVTESDVIEFALNKYLNT